MRAEFNHNAENLLVISLIFELKAAGFKVYRYKIEDTLLDSKSIDTLSIL